jgi:glycosyltransferase involved in cell wall biosynthesis
MTRFIYVRPAFGGIFDYSESVLAILAECLPAATIEVVTVEAHGDPLEEGAKLARHILSRPGAVLGDLGGRDAGMFWGLSAVSHSRKVLLTIHDPGLVVGELFRSARLEALSPLIRRITRSAGHRLERRFHARIVRRLLLERCAIRVVLNPSLAAVLGVPVEYLPQPVYKADMVPHPLPHPPKLAYLGYWGKVKGIEDLLQAYRNLLPRFPEARFVIAGGGVGADDPYARDFLARVRQVDPRIELPGFIPPAEIDEFLRGLTALVLPYHPDLAGGASAMLMRAQEAGVPLVVTDTPMLRAQVGRENVVMVPPQDGEALAGALADLLRNPEHYNARARAEQTRIHLEHSKTAVGRRLAALTSRLESGGT